MGPQSAVDREFVYIDLFSLFSLSHPSLPSLLSICP